MRKFTELFAAQPGFKILDITAHADGLTRTLVSALVPVGGRLSLVEYPGTHEAVAAEKGMTLQRQAVESYGKPFRALPRDNDVVFVRDVLHRHEQPERLLKSIYTTLGNAAEVVIVTRTDEADTEKQLEWLERVDFRAGNVIEGLAEGVTAVIGKKMHMWGNGL